MFEMSDSGEEHSDSQLVGLGNGIGIPDASARLHDGAHAVACSEGHGIVKRQEAVRSEHQTFGESCRLSFLEGNLS